MAGTAANLIGRGLDATGLTTGAADNALKNSDDLQRVLLKAQFNPDGGGNIAGNIASSLPLAEIKLLQAAPESGAIWRAIKYAAQGGVIGGTLSGGHDVGMNALSGAKWGLGGGLLGEGIAATGSRLAETETGKRLLAALMKGPKPAGATAADAEASYQASMVHGGPTFNRMSPDVQSGIAEMIDGGKSAADIAQAYPEWANTGKNAETIDWWVKHRAAGGKDPVNFQSTNATPGVGAQPSPADLAQGLKTASSARSIEKTTALPQKVADDVAAATAQGIPEKEAVNAASIRYVGGKPTLGTETRDWAVQQAEKEGAKATTTEGDLLRSRAEENNAALHATTRDTVDQYGGIPAKGEASQGVAESLANSSDAARAKVSSAYADARAQDGDQRVSIDGLRELLAKPSYRMATTTEGKQLVAGLKGQIAAMSRENGGRFSPEEIDALTKEANAAFNPMGGGANHMIGEVKGALGESLNQFDNAGPAFRAARSLHRQWAEQYSDPQGISRLIARDGKGNFLNQDNWRKAENGMIGTTDDASFVQVARQLKANGDTETLDRLKAEIVQRAFDKATPGTTDQGSNAIFRAKGWHDELNKIGIKKLEAVFSPEELAHLKTIGHAAKALHDAVPGTDNFPNTASAVMNALRGEAKPTVKARALALAIRAGGHTAALPLHLAGVGGVAHGATEVGAALATKASKASVSATQQKALAKGLRELLDPAAARTAANENAARAASQQSRKVLGSALGRYAATAAPASKGNR